MELADRWSHIQERVIIFIVVDTVVVVVEDPILPPVVLWLTFG